MQTSFLDLINPQDWVSVQRAYETSSPFNYVVIDNFLELETCKLVRQKLIQHWGWRRKNWVSYHLYNRKPNIPEIPKIADRIHYHCSTLLNGLSLVTYWALMYRDNNNGRVHSDDAGITVNIWLTDDCYNLNSTTGGLLLFDVKRDPNMLPHEYLVPPEEYIATNTRGNKVKIPYKFNRAIIFDSRTFHQTDRLEFVNEGTDSFRINLTLAFDNPSTYKTREDIYRRSL